MPTAPNNEGNGQGSQPIRFVSTTSGGSQRISEIETDLDGNIVFTPASTNSLDLLSNGNAKFRADILLAQTTANYTLSWDDPGAARTLNINDPGANAQVAMYLSTTDTVDLGSILDGDCSTARGVTVTGSVLGDAMLVSSSVNYTADGIFAIGEISVAGTAQWSLCNMSSASYDHANATFTIRVLK